MSERAPVILLTFANDQGEYLNMLTRESKGIEAALSRYEDQAYIRVKTQDAVTINDLFGLFNRFTGQVAILHYAGHANGVALNLEKEGGGNEVGNAGGLAQMMGQQAGLQLVFLNGCATRDQVKLLLGQGVKAVIATSVKINDAMATDFAGDFYQALGSGKSIRGAFAFAQAELNTRDNGSRPVEAVRGMSWGDAPETADTASIWGLYAQEDGDAALDWKLPTQAENQVIIRGAAITQPAGVAVNDTLTLTQALSDAVAAFSPDFGIFLEVAKRSGRLEMREVRRQIMDSFPAPVGEQVRKLFAGSTIDEARLRQLVVTYETTIKLFAFAMLSQLWNAVFDNPKLTMAPEHRAAIDVYLSLDAASAATFDYLALILAINAILAANRVPLFMSECDGLSAALNDEASARARQFMEEMRAELANGPPAQAEIESFCVQAEGHLGTIIADLAFIVRYKLATIKGIAISKSRHKAPEFLHRQVLLDRLSAGFEDTDQPRAAYTDNESVILLKDLADASNYLNLTPFVIDQNALTGNVNTKLYFLGWHDAQKDECHFYSIADATDRLTVPDATRLAAENAVYLPMRELIHEFREAMAPR